MRLSAVGVSLILFFTVAACDDSAGPAGTYRLREVNGLAVPMLATRHARGQAEIIEGAFTLDADGSYRARTLFRVRSDTIVYLDSAVHTGRYTSLGDSLIFRSTPGSRVNAAGQIDGSSLTFRYPGWAFVYRR